MLTLSRLRRLPALVSGLLSIGVLLAAPACNDGNPQLTTATAGECPAGSQGCPCISDGCFGDLECLGGVCIDPGGADSNPPGTDSASSATTSTSGATNVTTHSTTPTSDSETGAPTTTQGDSTTGSVTPGTTTSGEPPQTTGTTLPPDETDAGDESVGFIPNDTGEPPGGDCDIFKQDCSAGQKCMPYADDGGSSWNALMCSEIDASPDKIGATCSVYGSAISGQDSCAAGSMCFDLPPGELDGGTCIAFCKGTPQNPTCADPKTTCTISNEGVLALCLPKCDPLASTCKAGQVCVPNNEGGDFVCFLDASGGANQGDPCSYSNACSPGFICINGPYVQNCNSAACCTAFCDTDLANNCLGKPTVECIPWFEEGTAAPGYEDVGLCGIPQ